MRSVSQLSMSSVFMSWFLVEVIYNPGDSLKNTFNSPSFARPHDGKPASRVSDDRERVTSGVGARARRGQHRMCRAPGSAISARRGLNSGIRHFLRTVLSRASKPAEVTLSLALISNHTSRLETDPATLLCPTSVN